MNEKEVFDRICNYQREFDRRLGWNVYENLSTDEDVVDYMQLTVLKFSEEVGEIAQEIRRILRDRKTFEAEALRQNLLTYSFI